MTCDCAGPLRVIRPPSILISWGKGSGRRGEVWEPVGADGWQRVPSDLTSKVGRSSERCVRGEEATVTELRSQKQERVHLIRLLRAQGKSWVEIAADFRRRYRVNARVALRYAHGWSQRQAADAWNQRWPDELKTFKTFSYWEQRPGSTGHAPSFETLTKLAELYECAVSDLLVDLPDFRHRDRAAPAPKAGAVPPATRGVSPGRSSGLAATPELQLPDDLAALLTPYLGDARVLLRSNLASPREQELVYDRLV